MQQFTRGEDVAASAAVYHHLRFVAVYRYKSALRDEARQK
ncbi:hypothetical protein PC116_g18463 [Phytophthora cactorum]|nr:hypothetical protein PC116_g18463 [Phytophthora cactorum]